LSGATDAIRKPGARVGAVIAVALAAALVVWALIERGNDGTRASTDATGPVSLSYAGLTTLSGATRQPMYWVGPRLGTRYELRQLADGKVYVRYLPAKVKAGDPGKHLTIGMYPMKDAFSRTSALARSPGSSAASPGGGGVAFSGKRNASSVYVAFPGSDYQIEVYDPTPGEARRLVEQGAVGRVPASTPRAARAATLPELRRLSASLGQPIYWAGPGRGMTYEVSQNTEGSVYVRYVPEGVNIGDPRELRTVATYPLGGAYDRTKDVSGKPGMALTEHQGGGIAVFPNGAGAKHGYVAYRGSDYQVEVFDPDAGVARRLVKAGRIAPVG
jgi:hypothetical protein